METTPALNTEVFKNLIGNVPAILKQNSESLTKAESVGNQLVSEINALIASENGKPNFEKRRELDKKLNTYLTRVNETVKALKDRRTPITGLFDDVRKLFTNMEGKLDTKNAITFPGQIQAMRNKFAADEAAENKRIQEEQARTKLIESEKIRVKSEYETQLEKHFNDYVYQSKTSTLNLFESLTLENFDKVTESLKMIPVYPFQIFDQFKPTIYTNLQPADIQNIITNCKVGKFEAYALKFKTELTEYINSLVEKLESKRTELQDIAKAGEEEKARIQAEAEQRKSDEAKRIEKENLEKQLEASAQATVNEQAMQANLAFDLEKAQVMPSANVKEGYEIEVLTAAGWLEVISFYFQKEGLKKRPEDLGKIKLEQMKAFAEKTALKTDEKIESKSLVYKEVYKAKLSK